ncbi:radical SAM protein [bacterium]|nr:radical SAM protein [bacterium]
MWTKDITSLCPDCETEIPGQIFSRGGDLYLRRTCETHGETEVFFWRDEKTYRACLPENGHARSLPAGPLRIFSPETESFLTTLAIDITERCNLTCPTCVSAAKHIGDVGYEDGDLPMATLLDLIPDYRGREKKPNISLIGGESSLRRDLPEFVEAIIAQKGITPRLNSNGILLMDEARIERLWQAGLRWVILQFDGFTPAPSIEFRGADLSKQKFKVIERLSKRGFNIHLACMVARGVNDGEIGDILRFASSHANIRRVSFYPRSHIGRIEDHEAGSTHVIDVMNAIENGTGGEVTADDLLASKRLGERIHKVTHHPMFRPRPCIFPALLMREGDRLLSCHKLFSPASAWRHPRAFAKLARYGRRLLAPDDAGYPPDFLFINIEKFYDGHAFDVAGAHNCHHIYLTPQGALPFCVYNTRVRGKGVLQMGGGCG